MLSVAPVYSEQLLLYTQTQKLIMTHEKIYLMETGRSVKIIVRGYNSPTESGIRITLEVLIKDPKEEYFHAPIGVLHPQFWKLKKMDNEKARLLQITYSGISQKQINRAVREFEEIAASPVLL